MVIDKCLSAVLVIVSLCVIRAIIKTFKVRTKQRNLSSRDCLMTCLLYTSDAADE